MAGGSNYDSLRVAPTVKSGGAVSFVDSRMDNSVGKTLSAVSASANDFNAELYEQANKIRVQAAINDYATDMSDWLYNADTGLMNRKGKDVAAPKSGEAFGVEAKRGMEERLQKYFGGLSPSQQKIAREFVDRERINRNADFLRHESREIQSYGNEVLESALKLSANNIAKGGWDRERLTQELGIIDGHIAELGKLNGWSDEKVLSSALEFKTKTIQNLADILVSNDNLDGARHLLDEYGQTLVLNRGHLIRAEKAKQRERERKIREHQLLVAHQQREAAIAKAKRFNDKQAGLIATDALNYVQDSRQDGLRFSQFMMDNGIKLPKDVQEKYDAATTEIERREILRGFGTDAIVKAEGNYRVAIESALKDGTGEVDTNRANDLAMRYVGTPPPELTREELNEAIDKVRPGLSDEQRQAVYIKAAGQHNSSVMDRHNVEMNAIANAFTQLSRDGADGTYDKRYISPQGQRALNIYWKRKQENDLDTPNDAVFAYWMQNRDKLKNLPIGEVMLLRSQVSRSQSAVIEEEWQKLQNTGSKKGFDFDIRTDTYNKFDDAMLNLNPGLKQSDKTMYSIIKEQVTSRVMREWREVAKPGEKVDPEWLSQHVMIALTDNVYYKNGPKVYEGSTVNFSKEPAVSEFLTFVAQSADGVQNPSMQYLTNVLMDIRHAGPRSRYTTDLSADDLIRFIPEQILTKYKMVETNSKGQRVPTKLFERNLYRAVKLWLDEVAARSPGATQETPSTPWINTSPLLRIGGDNANELNAKLKNGGTYDDFVFGSESTDDYYGIGYDAPVPGYDE